MPDRENNKRRLDFQHYLIDEYVVKPHQSLDRSGYEITDRRGFVVTRQHSHPYQASCSDQKAKQILPSGYAVSGEENLTERFNVNNKELNKRRFLESNAHVFKHKLNGKSLKGAKFSNQELVFNLSPDTGKLDDVFS